MLVRDWMSPDPVTVTPSTPVEEARHLLRRYGVRHLPVVGADGRLVGVVSDRDVAVDEAALQQALSRLAELSRVVLSEAAGTDRTVATVMSSPPQIIGPDEPVEAAARLMLSRCISALPVVANDELVGVITTTDCLLASLTPAPAAPQVVLR